MGLRVGPAGGLQWEVTGEIESDELKGSGKESVGFIDYICLEVFASDVHL